MREEEYKTRLFTDGYDVMPQSEDEDVREASLFDQDSFALEEDGEVHTGIVDKKVDNNEPILANIDYIELKRRIYENNIARVAVESYANHHRCSWPEALKRLNMTDPDDLPAWGLTRADDGTYSLYSGKNVDDDLGSPDSLKDSEKELNSLDLFFKGITSDESNILRDIINIADLLKDPSYSVYESDFERKSLELIRSRARREALRFTKEQEQDFVKSFKDILIGHRENISLYANKINSINFIQK